MEKNITPLWNKLVNNHCIKKGQYGLTIPYLVGAEQSFKRSNFSIDLLFDEIKICQQEIIISFCSDLNEYIIGTYKKEYPNINDLKRFGFLFINDPVPDNFSNYLKLRAFLTQKYDSRIKNHKYSIDYQTNEWNMFDNDDLLVINNIFIK